MTFTDIVNDVADRLNISSSTGLTRIGTHVNRRYRRLTASIGMNVFRRVTVDFDPTLNTRTQTVTGIERIIAIYGPEVSSPEQPLNQLSYDEMLELVPTTDDPRAWAPKRMGASSVTFMLDSSVPDAITLRIEGEENASTLSGAQIPAFSESFHDILVFQALADELRKMEKQTLARDAELEASALTSELRLKLAVGAYQDILQGKGRTRDNPRINPSISVPIA